MQVVKQKVKDIEALISANPRVIPGQTGECRNHTVLSEYHAINGLQIMASDKSKHKEWNDELVNAIGQFRPNARPWLNMMRTFKD